MKINYEILLQVHTSAIIFVHCSQLHCMKKHLIPFKPTSAVTFFSPNTMKSSLQETE